MLYLRGAKGVIIYDKNLFLSCTPTLKPLFPYFHQGQGEPWLRTRGAREMFFSTSVQMSGGWGWVGLGSNRKVKSIPLDPIEILSWENFLLFLGALQEVLGLKIWSLYQQHLHNLGTCFRNANSQAPPRQAESETLGVEPSNQSSLAFQNIWYTLKFENHWPGDSNSTSISGILPSSNGERGESLRPVVRFIFCNPSILVSPQFWFHWVPTLKSVKGVG